MTLPNNMKVATLNAYGLNNEKTKKIEKRIKKEKIWITFICETWATPHRKFDKTIIAASAAPKKVGRGRATDGVALMINDEFINDDEVKIEKIVPGLAIRWSIGRMKFVGVYLPPRMEDADCIALLNSIYEAGDILLGDINARFGDISNDSAWNDRGLALIEWLSWNNVDLISPNVTKPTFVTLREGRICASIVDHIAAPPDFSKLALSEVLSHPEIDSDHRMVCCTFRGIEVEPRREKIPLIPTKRFNLGRLKDDRWKLRYRECLDSQLDQCQFGSLVLEDQTTIDEIENRITSSLRTAALNSIGEADHNKKQHGELTPEIKSLLKMRKRAYKIFCEAAESNSPPDVLEQLFATFVSLRKRVRKEIKLHQEKEWQTFTGSLLSKPASDILKQVKAMKNKRERVEGKLEVSESAMETYRTHYQKQFSRLEWQTPCPISPDPLGPENQIIPIGEYEVWSAMKNAPRRKAPGPTGIPNELLVPYSTSLVQCLAFLFNKILRAGCVPKAWTVAHIQPVPKKGDLKLISNYRPISLTENLRKLFERIILDRVRSVVEPLSASQGGFRRKRSTLDQIATLQELLMKSENRHIVFLDIRAAYDSVDRCLLWMKLNQRNCPRYLSDVLKALFDRNTAKVVLRGYQSCSLPFEMGVLQGSILSPLLYSLFIDDLTESLVCVKTKLRNQTMPCLMYADDIAIVTSTHEEMTEALSSCEMHSIRNNYRFNPSKCAIITNDTMQFKLYGEDIPSVDSFTYLGIPFRIDGMDTKAHAMAMAGKVVSSLKLFASIGIRSGGLPASVNAKIYKAFIRPKMEYGLALMHLRPKSKVIQILEKAENLAMASLVGGVLKSNRLVLRNLIGTDGPYERSLILRAKWSWNLRYKDSSFLIWYAYEEAKCTPRRQSCFYKCGSNEIVSDLSLKLFVEGLNGKRMRLFGKKDIAEVITSKVHQFRQNRAVASGSPILSNELTGEGFLRQIDLNVHISKRRALILWILRKILPLPKECSHCGMSVSYDHVQSCFAAPIDEKIKEGSWKQASVYLQMALCQLK